MRWIKTSDGLPVIGLPVVIAYGDGRQIVASSYPEQGENVWVTQTGRSLPAPEFWLDETQGESCG